MKLLDALDLAEACDLKTLKEAVVNVELHASNLFLHEDIIDELGELRIDLMGIDDRDHRKPDELTIAEAVSMRLSFKGGLRENNDD